MMNFHTPPYFIKMGTSLQAILGTVTELPFGKVNRRCNDRHCNTANIKTIAILLFILLLMVNTKQAYSQQGTYAERLGYPAGAKVVIFHVDDAGMSFEPNQGAKVSIEQGMASSCSIMMPCPWAADIAKHAIAHPEMDAGLHLTLTSEWKAYRWGPVAGKSQVPTLVDKEGNLWSTVEEVLQHATA